MYTHLALSPICHQQPIVLFVTISPLLSLRTELNCLCVHILYKYEPLSLSLSDLYFQLKAMVIRFVPFQSIICGRDSHALLLTYVDRSPFGLRIVKFTWESSIKLDCLPYIYLFISSFFVVPFYKYDLLFRRCVLYVFIFFFSAVGRRRLDGQLTRYFTTARLGSFPH
jgi:hypothetical protein